MAKQDIIHSTTVRQTAEQVLGLPLNSTEVEQVAGLLTALKADMSAMRRMPVENAEPATLYSAMERGK